MPLTTGVNTRLGNNSCQFPLLSSVSFLFNCGPRRVLICLETGITMAVATSDTNRIRCQCTLRFRGRGQVLNTLGASQGRAKFRTSSNHMLINADAQHDNEQKRCRDLHPYGRHDASRTMERFKYHSIVSSGKKMHTWVQQGPLVTTYGPTLFNHHHFL